MDEFRNFQIQINEIKNRNRKVETDKAWELSFTRRTTITLATYFFAVGWLRMIGASAPWLSALVPALGYVFSTLSLPLIKQYWEKKYFK